MPSSFVYQPSSAGRSTTAPLPYTQGAWPTNPEWTNICSRYGHGRVSHPGLQNVDSTLSRGAPAVSAPRRTGQHATRWVVAQIPLLALTIVVPLSQLMLHTPGPWIGPLGLSSRVLGFGLLVVAVMVFRAAERVLGPALVATPMPVSDATLRDSGVYGVVRHPIYAAIIAGIFGWALLWNSVACLVLTALCGMFFLAKIRYEEELLLDAFAGYQEYKRKVPALIPRWRGSE